MDRQPEKEDGLTAEPAAGTAGLQLSDEAAAVVDAAGNAADAVRHAGEHQAERIRAEAQDYHDHLLQQARQTADAFLADHVRRIDEISEPAIAAAERVLRRLDDTERVVRELEASAAALGQEAERAAEGFGRTAEPAPPTIDGDGDGLDAPAARPRRRFTRTAPGADVRAARLAALQMAVAGSTRGEIEAHLEAHFDCPEAFSVLDEVFGTVGARA